MSLATDLIETARQLSGVVEDETQALIARAKASELKVFADSKALLSDRLEHLGEAVKRAGKAALLAEPPALRASLSDAVAALNTALAENGKILGRRKALSEGLIEAVLSEAKRQAGTQLSAYGSAAPRTEKAAAIAYNAQA